MLDLRKFNYEGNYAINHTRVDQELGGALSFGPRQAHSIKRSPGGESLIYDVTYTINALGLRDVPHNGAGPPAFFFGDSFTFGEGVGDTDTLPARFAQMSGFSVFNFGVHGYGVHQFLRMLEISRVEELGIRKEHPLVVFTLLPTHVDRGAGSFWDPGGPLYEISSTGINFRGSFLSHRGITDRILNKSYIYKRILPILLETKNRSRLLAMVERANEIVKHRYGTDMLVVVWDTGLYEPTKYDVARATWIRDSLAKSGIASISVSQIVPKLQGADYYIAGDGHPNPVAYAAVAEAIFRFCNDTNCLKRP